MQQYPEKLAKKIAELTAKGLVTDDDMVELGRIALEAAKDEGLTDDEFAKRYPLLQQRISAMNPSKTRAIPSSIEALINKVCGKEPVDKKFYIGPKPEEGAVLEAVLDRKQVVDVACTLTDRVSKERLQRFADAIFNDGISVDQLKKIAVHDISTETTTVVSDIFDSAGVANPTIEDAEAVSAIARAMLRHIMTHHKDELPKLDRVTPFAAWRVKEKIVKSLVHAERVLVNPQGFDTSKQLDEFEQYFPKTEIVLWNKDIWDAATRKCEIFAGTVLGKQLVEDTIPMFWQFERRFGLPEKQYFELDRQLYYCAGFVILPHSEEHVKVTFDEKDVTHFNKGGQDFIELNTDNEGVRKAVLDARDDEKLHFARHGISISSIFIPIAGGIPEIRFMLPLYEDDVILERPAFYHNVLAALQFLSTKYVTKENAVVSKKELKDDRQLFKQVRKGKVQVPPIKIINLRRPERPERQSDSPARKVNWTCHWFVEPHWHKYYHKTEDRWIRHYLMTYPKGDLTKPLKPPREKVFKAIR